MSDTTRPFAIVTGASSGIGYELAQIAAEDGYDLLIVADRHEISEAAEKLRAYGGSVDAIETDLATVAGVNELHAAAKGRSVDLLFANAGQGIGGAFLDQEFGTLRHVVDTNVTGTIYLIHKIGREMRARNSGRILITGSIAGYIPGSFHAVYNSSKAFIDSFAWALRDELKDTDVTVTVLMPGATDTDFFEHARMKDTRFGTMKKDDPAFVARVGYDAMMRGEADVVSGLKNKLQVIAASVTPGRVTAAMHRMMAKPGSGRPQTQRDGASGDGFVVKALLGAAAGVAGVWALDRADWFMWNREDLDSRAKTIKVRPRHLPPAENVVSAVTETMDRELPRPAFEAASQAVHYSIGVAPAIGYALLRDKLPLDGITRGALYGVGMFLAKDEVLNTVTGLGAKPRDYPWQAHARGLVAHAIYGIATELALNFLEEWTSRRDRGHEQRTPTMSRGREERSHVVH